MQEFNRLLDDALKMQMPVHSKEGNVAWQCPSNIALIKYWGKRDVQLPMNPSLSFTLKEATTKTKVSYSYSPERKEVDLKYMFEDAENIDFSKRIHNYLAGLTELLPYIPNIQLRIESENSFPHSSGIASSASAFGALALCLVEIEEQLTGIKFEPDAFFKKASFIARLGSGSASRSAYGGLVLWGETDQFQESSDEFAIPVSEQLNNSFPKFYDAILLLDKKPKLVSSSAGHSMMHHNPYSSVRFEQAEKNLKKLTEAIRKTDLHLFFEIAEYEALSLHAMMLTSYPGYLLLQPNSLEVIQRIRDYRARTKVELGFTIDAGANIHLLFPAESKQKAIEFIEKELKPFCSEGSYLLDQVGEGPLNLNA